jgi:hypothetical protein
LQKFSQAAVKVGETLRDSLSLALLNNNASQYWTCYGIPKQNISIILEIIISTLFLLVDILQIYGD